MEAKLSGPKTLPLSRPYTAKVPEISSHFCRRFVWRWNNLLSLKNFFLDFIKVSVYSLATVR